MSDAPSTLDVVAAPPNVGGRPTVKTPENRARIIAEVREGTPKTCAAVYCGIGRSTFHEWENEDPAFVEELEAAEQAYFDSLRKAVEAGTLINGTADWRAKWEILKARDRKTYGKPDAASSVTVNGPTINNIIAISPEQLADLQARRKAATEGLANGRN